MILFQVSHHLTDYRPLWVLCKSTYMEKFTPTQMTATLKYINFYPSFFRNQHILNFKLCFLYLCIKSQYFGAKSQKANKLYNL